MCINEGLIRLGYLLKSYFHSLLCPNVKIWNRKYIANGGYHRALPIKCTVRSITAFQRLSTSNLPFIDKHLLFLQWWFSIKVRNYLGVFFEKNIQFFQHFFITYFPWYQCDITDVIIFWYHINCVFLRHAVRRIKSTKTGIGW
jgi:hypothetical protein